MDRARANRASDTSSSSTLVPAKRALPTRQTQGYPRKRASKACKTCRIRKTKCNNERPVCGSCQSLESVCDYEDETDVSVFDPASQVILQRIEELSKKIDQNTSFTRPRKSDLRESSHSASLSVRQVQAGSRASTPHSESAFSVEVPKEIENELFIPACRTAPDCILKWPVIQEVFESTKRFKIEDELFLDSFRHACHGIPQGDHNDVIKSQAFKDAVPRLVDSFLRTFQVQYPILDAETLKRAAAGVPRNGCHLDVQSCLILIISALGAISMPSRKDLSPHTYYVAALERVGFLTNNLRSIQSLFFFGVYETYFHRPLRAYTKFSSASSSLLVFLKSRRTWQALFRDTEQSLDEERDEASLYWSCYAAICDLRTEISLPSSPLFEIDYPRVLPPPPTDITATLGFPQESSKIFGVYNGRLPILPKSDDLEIKAPSSARPYNRQLSEGEKAAWLYYMTSIIIHRLGNRIIRTLYLKDHSSWNPSNLNDMLQAVNEFECKLEHWYHDLPAVLKFAEHNRTPHLQTKLQNLTAVLSLTTRLILYQPFLYYLLHHRSTFPPAPFVPSPAAGIFLELPTMSSQEVEDQIRDFAMKAVHTCEQWVIFLSSLGDIQSLGWVTARRMLSASLLLYAAMIGGVTDDSSEERAKIWSAVQWLKDCRREVRRRETASVGDSWTDMDGADMKCGVVILEAMLKRGD